MTRRVTTSDGVGLAVEATGAPDAPTLLFLNSLGCDRSMWDEQASALQSRYRVVRFDARGHGASDAPQGEYTLDRLGRDALEVLDAVGAPHAHVCGLSLGGLTAQWAAIHAPDRVDRLVLANTASRIGDRETWAARRSTVLDEGLGAIAEPAMGRFFSDATRAARPGLVARMRARLEADSPVGYAGCCAALRDADLTPELGAIAAPTLVIGGERDVSTPPEQARALAAAIPDARLRFLDTAHLSNVEDPAGFTEALRAHLEDG